MINCPNCGADNMIGAIFCRGCGKKLNLDELSPDAFDEPEEPLAKRIARIVQRVVTLILLVAVAVLLAGLFWPAKGVVQGELDDQQTKTSDLSFKLMQRPSRKRPRVTFTSEQATAVLNQTLGLPGSSKGNKQAEHISVEFLAGGSVRLVLKSMLFGQIPMYTTLVGRPELSSPGNVTFSVQDVHAGKLPMVGNLQQNGIKQFTSLISAAGEINTAEGNVTSFEISQNLLTVTMRVK